MLPSFGPFSVIPSTHTCIQAPLKQNLLHPFWFTNILFWTSIWSVEWRRIILLKNHALAISFFEPGQIVRKIIRILFLLSSKIHLHYTHIENSGRILCMARAPIILDCISKPVMIQEVKHQEAPWCAKTFHPLPKNGGYETLLLSLSFHLELLSSYLFPELLCTIKRSICLGQLL